MAFNEIIYPWYQSFLNLHLAGRMSELLNIYLPQVLASSARCHLSWLPTTNILNPSQYLQTSQFVAPPSVLHLNPTNIHIYMLSNVKFSIIDIFKFHISNLLWNFLSFSLLDQHSKWHLVFSQNWEMYMFILKKSCIWTHCKCTSKDFSCLDIKWLSIFV